MAFPDNNHLNIHKNSQRHISKVTGVARVSKAKNKRKTAQIAADRAKKRYYCDTNVDEQRNLDRHYKTKKHIGNVAAAAAMSKSSSVLDKIITLLSGILDFLDFNFSFLHIHTPGISRTFAKCVFQYHLMTPSRMTTQRRSSRYRRT